MKTTVQWHKRNYFRYDGKWK